jgi:hypothetical protein
VTEADRDAIILSASHVVRLELKRIMKRKLKTLD